MNGNLIQASSQAAPQGEATRIHTGTAGAGDRTDQRTGRRAADCVAPGLHRPAVPGWSQENVILFMSQILEREWLAEGAGWNEGGLGDVSHL